MGPRDEGRSDASAPAAASVTDSAGERTRPVVDLRVVLFAVNERSLLVACRPIAEGRLELPRGLPDAHVPLDLEARRIVREQVGFREEYLEQLYTVGYDADGAWTVIVSYLGLAKADAATESTALRWLPTSGVGELSLADRLVVEYAVTRLQAKLGYTTIAFYLLPPTFTIRELQTVYETVLGRPLDKRNFRRRVIAARFLEETGALRRDGSHRPAHVYRFRSDHDRESYLTPPWAAAP